MRKTLCHSVKGEGLGFPIALYQTDIDRFEVRYGRYGRTGLTYSEAAEEYGECILHALACSGRIAIEAGEIAE